ncbi:hypothetical protein BG000_003688 [Podila horticola]|nr:hypothetical protein BG000_003688 [Podila horticola]
MIPATFPPELLISIAEYLTPGEAKAPSVVCRSWHDIFESVIWRTYDIAPRTSVPSLETRAKYARHTKTLMFFGHDMDIQDDLLVPYTQLTRISFNGPSRPNLHQEHMCSHLVRIIENNQQLQDLTISEKNLRVPAEVWSAIELLPELRELHVRDISKDVKGWEALWNGCQGLRTLAIYVAYVRGSAKLDDEVLEMHPELQSFTLQEPDFLPLLRRCPNLRHVSWESNGSYDRFMDELVNLLRGGKLQNLESLRTRRTDIQQLVSALTAMNHIKEVSVDNAGSENVSYHLPCHVLTEHFATLQKLTLPNNAVIPDGFVARVLASCPLLTTVALPKTTASEIISGEPWVCSRLARFMICIEIQDSERETIRNQSREIFGRLSKLPSLIVLNIGPAEHAPIVQGLDLRLESGIDQLLTLTRLERLNFYLTIQDMSAEDVAWMKNMKSMTAFNG